LFCAFVILLAAVAQAQKQGIHIQVNFAPCTQGGNPPGYSEDTVKVSIGETQWTANPIYVPAGTQNLHVLAQNPYSQGANWIIRDITFQSFEGPQKLPSNVTEVDVPINVTYRGPGAALPRIEITVDTCRQAPPAVTSVHLQIVTPKSCTDAPGQDISIADGTTVAVGTSRVTSNEKGVAVLDLPPGTYPVSALWKDAVLGFVAQNGVRVPINEGGTILVTLSKAQENIEVRMLTCDQTGQEKTRAVVTELNGTMRFM